MGKSYCRTSLPQSRNFKGIYKGLHLTWVRAAETGVSLEEKHSKGSSSEPPGAHGRKMHFPPQGDFSKPIFE